MILSKSGCPTEIISQESNYGDEMSAPPTRIVNRRGFAT